MTTATDNSRFGKVRSKLARKKTPSTSASMADAAADLRMTYDKTDIGYEVIDVPVINIHKVYNPRVTPCSFEEFKSVDWPSLETPHEDIKVSIIKALNHDNSAWWTSLSGEKQEDILEFLFHIHLLSVSLKDTGQHQNIVVHRESLQSNHFELIAGERRILASLYSKGLVTVLIAKCYNYTLSALEIAQIRDEENEKQPLSTQEKISSKYGVWLALTDKERETLQLNELALLWRYNTVSVPSVLRRLFKHEDVDSLLQIIHERKLQIRDIEFIIKNGLDAFDASLEAQSQETEEIESPKNKASPKKHGISTVETGSAGRMKEFGVQLGKKAKPDIFQFALRIISKSDHVPASLREKLGSIDLDSADDLMAGLALIADFVEEE